MGANLTIRVAGAADASGLAALCHQLGRHAPREEVRAYLERGESESGRHLLVAVEGSSIVGWLEVARRTALASGDWAEISGLVVDEQRRSQGVGSELLRAARAWAQGEGLVRLRVRTLVERERAARFYARAGFRLSKHQCVYELEL